MNNPLALIDPTGMNDCPDNKSTWGDDPGTDTGAAGVDLFGASPSGGDLSGLINLMDNPAARISVTLVGFFTDSISLSDMLNGSWGPSNGGGRGSGGGKGWWSTFASEFFKFSGGPGNVPTCAGQALTHIAEEFMPFVPGGASVIQATAPAAQAMAFNNAVTQTEARIDAYIAAQGLTTPLRSSVVRAMAAQGAKSAVGAGARANLAVQTFAVDYAAIKSTSLLLKRLGMGNVRPRYPYSRR
jgi:hypothetical protein